MEFAGRRVARSAPDALIARGKQHRDALGCELHELGVAAVHVLVRDLLDFVVAVRDRMNRGRAIVVTDQSSPLEDAVRGRVVDADRNGLAHCPCVLNVKERFDAWLEADGAPSGSVAANDAVHSHRAVETALGREGLEVIVVIVLSLELCESDAVPRGARRDGWEPVALLQHGDIREGLVESAALGPSIRGLGRSSGSVLRDKLGGPQRREADELRDQGHDSCDGRREAVWGRHTDDRDSLVLGVGVVVQRRADQNLGSRARHSAADHITVHIDLALVLRAMELEEAEHNVKVALGWRQPRSDSLRSEPFAIAGRLGARELQELLLEGGDLVRTMLEEKLQLHLFIRRYLRTLLPVGTGKGLDRRLHAHPQQVHSTCGRETEGQSPGKSRGAHGGEQDRSST
mmetsp:Transcript_4950/g.14740  ORF Transcript_4950/g.14740 Transcript_4950/m.14740 type:complete len:402 (-) Transcript_4950:14-1219(-)